MAATRAATLARITSHVSGVRESRP